MSGFQFPSNPSDGDLVVRGDLQAYYNGALNTWRVSRMNTIAGIPGPPGPPGPQGPPGQGLEITGSVNTYAGLPPASSHQWEAWLVEDEQALYLSNGVNWVIIDDTFQLAPQYAEFQGETFDGAWLDRQDLVDFGLQIVTVEVPANTTAATVSWFQNSTMYCNPDRPAASTGIHTYMGQSYATVDVVGGNFTQSNMGVYHIHNTATQTYAPGVNERISVNTSTKTNEVRYPLGTTQLTFTRRLRFVKGKNVRMAFGLGRLTVTPYIHADTSTNYTTYAADIPANDPEFIPPATPAEILEAQAADLKYAIRDGILDGQILLTLYPTYVDDAQKATIENAVANLAAARGNTGTYQEIKEFITPYLEALKVLVNFKFQFEL